MEIMNKGPMEEALSIYSMPSFCIGNIGMNMKHRQTEWIAQLVTGTQKEE